MKNIHNTLLILTFNCVVLFGCALSTKVYEHNIQTDLHKNNLLSSESVLLIAVNQ
jgi:hypothetical protein